VALLMAAVVVVVVAAGIDGALHKTSIAVQDTAPYKAGYSDGKELAGPALYKLAPNGDVSAACGLMEGSLDQFGNDPTQNYNSHNANIYIQGCEAGYLHAEGSGGNSGTTGTSGS
jgi:hypothetical protein